MKISEKSPSLHLNKYHKIRDLINKFPTLLPPRRIFSVSRSFSFLTFLFVYWEVVSFFLSHLFCLEFLQSNSFERLPLLLKELPSILYFFTFLSGTFFRQFFFFFTCFSFFFFFFFLFFLFLLSRCWLQRVLLFTPFVLLFRFLLCSR